MTSLKWMIPLFALFTLTLTGWIQYVRGDEPIIPWIYFSSETTGNTDLYRMRPNGTQQYRLTFMDDYELYNVVHEQWIYFTTLNAHPAVGHTTGFYQIRPDGTQQERLLDENANFWKFSPDNKWIYYYADQNLHRMRADGTQPTQLTYFDQVLSTKFSTDHKWIYFSYKMNSSWRLGRMHLDGSAQQFLVDIANYDTFYGFSPDKQWIYFGVGDIYGYTIYRMNLTDFTQEKLTPDGYQDVFPYGNELRLSLDGQWLYFSSKPTSNDRIYDVYRMHLDGSAREQLTNFPDNTMFPSFGPIFSPNGEWVYFLRYMNNTVTNTHVYQLFGMHPDGTAIYQLSDSTTDAYVMSFSPDGEWVYFSGDDDIYRMRLDGSQQQNLTSSLGRDYLWEFSHDANWIYFTADHTGFNQIYRMHLDGTHQEELSPTFKGDEFWGGFSDPVNWQWHQAGLRIYALSLLGIWGGVSFWQFRHRKHLTP